MTIIRNIGCEDIEPMIFGGLHKNSLIDYPGKLSCVLFLSGCNFKCPYCHNPRLATNCGQCEPSIKETRVIQFLDERKDFLDGVVITGGEPTLQNGLPAFCERLKRMDYPVKLDTNGSRPDIIKELIRSGLVDYIAMDIKTDPFNYSPLMKNGFSIKNILTSIVTIMESAPAYEFRTTCVKPLITKQILENICHLISGSRRYVLQQFNDTDILEPSFFHETDRLYTDEELNHLRSIAAPWVNECFVR